MGEAPAALLGPLRTLVSVTFVVVLVWAAFAIKLGDRTFADHMDRIGETEEARALLDGARGRVRPALDEAKQRLLGEYVEAPTFVASPAPATPRTPAVVTVPQPRPAKREAPARASTEAVAADSGQLPGRRGLR